MHSQIKSITYRYILLSDTYISNNLYANMVQININKTIDNTTRNGGLLAITSEFNTTGGVN